MERGALNIMRNCSKCDGLGKVIAYVTPSGFPLYDWKPNADD